jgi:molybdate transport system regulatory protein
MLQMTLWIISGAASGVGKTFVAKRLCALLPGAVYAKQGHGVPKADKAANYFTTQRELQEFVRRKQRRARHLVMESNSCQAAGRHVVRIFLAVGPDTVGTREDAPRLEAQADIVINGRATADEWLAVLRQHLSDEGLAAGICSVFAEQDRLLNPAKVSVRSKVWLVNQRNELVFGAGLAGLVEDVEHLGSLRAAAGQANMSYRHAWGAIKSAELHLGIKLLNRSTGGISGGGSQLTAEGKRLLALYRRLSEAASAAADVELARSGGEGRSVHGR